MLWLLVLIAIVAIVYFVRPGWLPRPSQVREDANRALQRATETANDAYGGVTGRWKQLRGTEGRAAKFKEWVGRQTVGQESELTDKLPGQAQAMTAWLETLPDKEMEEFTDKVARYTASLGLDLEWLLDNKVNAYPALKQTIEQTVALYSISAWQAENVQRDVKAFRAYQAWEENPSRNRVLGQRLYADLVREGLAPTQPDLYLASQKERDDEAVRAIKDVAATKPEVVTAIVREWVIASEPAQIESVPQVVA
jgi:hypothetical protein